MAKLTSHEVVRKLRSVVHIDDEITNKNPKFHTVAVHEVPHARWAAIELKDSAGQSYFKPARFTPGVLKRAIDSAHKNFDDFEDREDVTTDASRIAELEVLEALVDELTTTKQALQEEVASLTQSVQIRNEEIQAITAKNAAAKVQTLADELIEANSSKGWFAGDRWWKDVLRNHGADV